MTFPLHKNRINYSQCWEDPRILLEALAINNLDTVLSVTSGGCNVLNILLAKPTKVVVVDYNPTQNHLFELKFNSAQALDYDEYLEFLGVNASNRRLVLFEKMASTLSIEARIWWLGNKKMMEHGVIHGGKFERYLNMFRSVVLPFIHSKKDISRFLSSESIFQQRRFYDENWNTKWWRLFFRLFSSRFLLKKIARQPGMFKYVRNFAVGKEYLQRSTRVFKDISLRDNYFIRYCLTGGYDSINIPSHFEYQSYLALRKVNRPTIVTSDIFAYLKNTPDDTFSKFNLSDVFEALSTDESASLWREILRTAKDGAVIAYWNNLVSRSFPEDISKNVYDDNETANRLFGLDRVFFYKSFHINKICK